MTLTDPIYLLIAAVVSLIVAMFGVLAHLRPGVGVRVVGQNPLALSIGMALVLLGIGAGLAGPRYGLPEVPRLTLHVVIDASRSMRVRDVAGRSRWETAIKVLDRMWDEPSSGVRFSLDLLTGDSIPLLPPGEDKALLRDALRAILPGDLGSPGTSLGRGLTQLAGQIERGAPAAVLYLGDGEETWERREDALMRAGNFLKEQQVPFYAVCLGGTSAREVPWAQGEREVSLQSRAQPDFLKTLAEASGGRLFRPEEDLMSFFLDLAEGKEALPLARSLQPLHPEFGAWLALAGLALWLLSAGKPLKSWRSILIILFLWGNSPPLRSEGPLPESVKAWLAQAAIDRGDLEGARKYKLSGDTPMHRLLMAQVELKSRDPQKALDALGPLIGQGVPRPLPEWRTPALLLAARAHVALNQREEGKALLERLLREEPGRKEAVHNLQSLTKDLSPPPPPKNPPPPPPPRPSQGARQDELEGIRQRLPHRQKKPGGVVDK